MSKTTPIGAKKPFLWQNYAANSFCTPKEIFYPQSANEIADIVKLAKREKTTVRVYGDSHSYCPLVPTQGYLISTKKLNKVLSSVEEIRATGKLWVEPGVTVDQTLKVYEESGFVLPMNVDVPPITIGGAISVGANGFGKNFSSYSDFVEAVELIDGNGDLKFFTREKHPEEMKAISCSLGLCGVFTKIQLKLTPMFIVRVINKKLPISEALDRMKENVEETDYWQIFWFATTDVIQVQTTKRVENVPPTKGASAREFFSNLKGYADSVATKLIVPMLTHEPELTPLWAKTALASLPENNLVMIQSDNVMLGNWINSFPPSENISVNFPVELNAEGYALIRKAWDIGQDLVGAYQAKKLYPANLEMNTRVFKTSTCYLMNSPHLPSAYTCNIQMTTFKNPMWARFGEELIEQWLRIPGARPHWGKQYQHVPQLYPKIRQNLGTNLASFLNVVKTLDPNHIFVNEFLGSIFEIPVNNASDEMYEDASISVVIHGIKNAVPKFSPVYASIVLTGNELENIPLIWNFTPASTGPNPIFIAKNKFKAVSRMNLWNKISVTINVFQGHPDDFIPDTLIGTYTMNITKVVEGNFKVGLLRPQDVAHYGPATLHFSASVKSKLVQKDTATLSTHTPIHSPHVPPHAMSAPTGLLISNLPPISTSTPSSEMASTNSDTIMSLPADSDPSIPTTPTTPTSPTTPITPQFSPSNQTVVTTTSSSMTTTSSSAPTSANSSPSTPHRKKNNAKLTILTPPLSRYGQGTPPRSSTRGTSPYLPFLASLWDMKLHNVLPASLGVESKLGQQEFSSKTKLQQFYPKSRNEIVDLVKKAREAGAKIRCRYPNVEDYNDGTWCINFVQESAPQDATKKAEHDLFNISLEGASGNDMHFVRVGAAVTYNSLREWCNSNNVALPFNDGILNLPISSACVTIPHGKGLQCTTVCDLIHEIEFVNAAGKFQKLTAYFAEEQELMKTACASLGLIGIPVSLVLKLEKNYQVQITPAILQLRLAIPPPEMEATEKNLRCIANFEKRCMQHHNEFTWFIGDDNCYINCWDSDKPNYDKTVSGENDKTSEKLPEKVSTDTAISSTTQSTSVNNNNNVSTKTSVGQLFPTSQEISQGYILRVFLQFCNDPSFKLFPVHTQVQLFSRCVLSTLHTIEPYTTTLSNANHFLPFLQDLREFFWEFEVIAPVPSQSTDPTKPDWNYIRKTFWTIVDVIHHFSPDGRYPCHIVRMNISKSSDVTMAPQNFLKRYNFAMCFSFASIPEIISFFDWYEFTYNVVEALGVDPAGNQIPIKFHWGKQYDHVTINGKHYLEYAVKSGFASQIPKFKKDIKAIAKLGGSKYKHSIECFSNSTLEFLLNETTKLPASPVDSVPTGIVKRLKKKSRSRQNSVSEEVPLSVVSPRASPKHKEQFD